MLNNEQKKSILNNLNQVAESFEEVLYFASKGKLEHAKVSRADANKNMGDASKTLESAAKIAYGENIKDFNTYKYVALVKAIEELTPELQNSKLVPIAKAACSVVPILELIERSPLLDPPATINTNDSSYSSMLNVCEAINKISNKYDANAVDFNKHSAAIISYLTEPMKLVAETAHNAKLVLPAVAHDL